MKRIADVLLSMLALAALSPILAATAIAVRVTLGAPVIFSQERPGLNGELFRMYKFRTMTDERDASGALLPDCQRLTRHGQFLRTTSIDELPELWNVLIGEMSLVGPRPLLVRYLGQYTSEQARRHEVRPGITGLAQVSGRNELPWDERLALDVWYVDNHTMWLDLKILARTVMKVLKREGVSQVGHATMSEFRGTAESGEDAS